MVRWFKQGCATFFQWRTAQFSLGFSEKPHLLILSENTNSFTKFINILCKLQFAYCWILGSAYAAQNIGSISGQMQFLTLICNFSACRSATSRKVKVSHTEGQANMFTFYIVQRMQLVRIHQSSRKDRWQLALKT